MMLHSNEKVKLTFASSLFRVKGAETRPKVSGCLMLFLQKHTLPPARHKNVTKRLNMAAILENYGKRSHSDAF